MARRLQVEIVGDASSLQRAFGKAEASSGRFGRRFGTVAKGAGIAALGIGGAVAFGLKKSIDSANEHAVALAQTKAVLKSTGGVANVTAEQITGLADAIEKKTGFDDVAVEKAQNLLATFTDVRNEVGKGNDVFTQATRTIVDMSVALGQDTKASAIQLGKALNDPVKGVTALSKVGVSFTEGQKKQIKTLTESGHKLQAQKVILRELKKEFGGSAEAAGKTLPGQLAILKARLDDVAQRIGERIVPALSRVVEWTDEHWPQISRVFDRVFSAIGAAWVALQPSFQALLGFARRTVAYIREHWPEISQTITEVAGVIRTVWNALGPTLTKVFLIAARTIVPLVESIARVVKGVVEIIRGILHGDWALVWKGFSDVVGGAFRAIKTLLVAETKIFAVYAKAVGHAIKTGIAAGLHGLGRLVVALVKAPINAVIDSINRLKLPAFKVSIPHLGTIKSPAIDPIPHIPRLAEGGIAVRPTLAMIGEKGPEAVIPLGRRSAADTRPVHVHLHLDGREIADVVTGYQQRAARRTTVTRRGRFAGLAQ